MVGQEEKAAREQLNARPDAVDDAAEAARKRADAHNEADKAQITAEEKAQKAQIEADKMKLEAQAGAQKQIARTQKDAAQGTPGAVQSGTATERRMAAVERQAVHGRITSVDSSARTLTVTDDQGRQEFKLDNKAVVSRLKEGEQVTVKFHQMNGAKIVDTIDVVDEQRPPQP